MREQFRTYIVSLYQNIPAEVYEGLLSVCCLGLVLLLVFCGIKKGLRYSLMLLLIEYVFLLFCSTVIFRTPGETRQYDFHPFWSYSRPDLLVENIMNVVVFIPVGMILGSLLRVKGSWSPNGSWLMVKGSWLLVAIIGCGISVTIEAIQFFLMRGFSEVDDVMHNTVGCLFGWFMVKCSRLMVKAKLRYEQDENRG